MKLFQEGNIFINGVSIKDIDIDDLRKHIVYIPQHPKLFNRTLEENLLYGLPSDVKIEHIFKFMIDNGFSEFEKIFRARLHEKVGKTGGNFSGGQRSIIFMIRAFFKKCSLICADEITSALDPVSTEQIKKMLNIISKNKALIIITHDMKMTNMVDRTIKLEKGKIISDNNKNKN
jgi:ATP-binding cassette subfamily C protein LapB